MRLGRHLFNRPVALAPMAGVTDRPFRILCKRLGADLAFSEMVTSNSALFATPKTRTRMDHRGETEPRIIQIAGGDVAMMVEAAQLNESLGAHVIDINMGCPAKKVCNKLAGSALLSDELLVYKILAAVVKSVSIPVTLKIRTGPDRDNRNGLTIGRIAEECGVSLLSVHGRTRADKFLGEAEYETIAQIVQQLSIPVLANGDITTPEDAARVLQMTGAAGIMVGRAAQGNPWIFREIKHYLDTGQKLPGPDNAEKASVLKWHLLNLYELYGEYSGVRIARKHIAWYCKGKSHAAEFRQRMYRLESAEEQLSQIDHFFNTVDETNSISRITPTIPASLPRSGAGLKNYEPVGIAS
ncbi:tRNA dihydrouridine synthase DusB [Chromatiales bacterium (ex Bugula neritina AB1)]|nr:tRNA dihydrouridine synthase DusB [Chromatiales bacterium (ex Bugula neritina AB1)]